MIEVGTILPSAAGGHGTGFRSLRLHLLSALAGRVAEFVCKLSVLSGSRLTALGRSNTLPIFPWLPLVSAGFRFSSHFPGSSGVHTRQGQRFLALVVIALRVAHCSLWQNLSANCQWLPAFLPAGFRAAFSPFSCDLRVWDRLLEPRPSTTVTPRDSWLTSSTLSVNCTGGYSCAWRQAFCYTSSVAPLQFESLGSNRRLIMLHLCNRPASTPPRPLVLATSAKARIHVPLLVQSRECAARTVPGLRKPRHV